MSVLFATLISIIVFVFILKSAIVVPQHSAYIIERLGKYVATAYAGFHFHIPFIDRVAYRLSLKQQILELPNKAYKSKDNSSINLCAEIHYVIFNPVQTAYAIADIGTGILDLAETALRKHVNDRNFNEISENVSDLSLSVFEDLKTVCENFGVRIQRFSTDMNTSEIASLRDKDMSNWISMIVKNGGSEPIRFGEVARILKIDGNIIFVSK